MKNNFPRLIIAATQSGSGKTTITTGLIAALKNRGLNVQAYKVGPDYIDTGWHELAGGKPSHNLDSWLVGKDKLKEIFIETSSRADISIIEGVMGLYDGGRGGISSTAEISKLLDAPVILVIDAKSMGTSAAAIALGFREFDRSVNIAGVILNRIGSDSHKKMIVDALDRLGIKCFGAIRRNDEFTLPERHLGLVPTTENNAVDALKKICAAVEEQIEVDTLIKLARNSSSLENVPPLLITHSSLRIAVAKDAAFSFYYGESLRELENLGAEIIFFSPLHDKNLPENISGLIIGGGFPEMFAARLEQNKSIRAEIYQAAQSGLPIFAECGGFMYLMRELIDFDGKNFEMCGVIDGAAIMTNKLQTVGYVEAEILNDCAIGKAGDKLHAHEFHFSKELETSGEKIFKCKRMRTGKEYFAGVAKKNLVASYLHIHFAGCPDAAKTFVDTCKNFRREMN